MGWDRWGKSRGSSNTQKNTQMEVKNKSIPFDQWVIVFVEPSLDYTLLYMLTSCCHLFLKFIICSKVDLTVLVPAYQTAHDQTASRSSYSLDCPSWHYSAVMSMLLQSVSLVCRSSMSGFFPKSATLVRIWTGQQVNLDPPHTSFYEDCDTLYTVHSIFQLTQICSWSIHFYWCQLQWNEIIK